MSNNTTQQNTQMVTRNALKNSNKPAEITSTQSFTLEILTDQLKLLRSDIANDFLKHKEEIISHLQQENLYLKSGLRSVKKELKKRVTIWLRWKATLSIFSNIYKETTLKFVEYPKISITIT